MRAAGEIDREPLAQCGPAGRHRGARRTPRALDHLRRPWKPDQPLLRRVQVALRDLLDVVPAVGPLKILVAHDWRLTQLDVGQFGLHPLAQHPIFPHRKSMPWW